VYTNGILMRVFWASGWCDLQSSFEKFPRSFATFFISHFWQSTTTTAAAAASQLGTFFVVFVGGVRVRVACKPVWHKGSVFSSRSNKINSVARPAFFWLCFSTLIQHNWQAIMLFLLFSGVCDTSCGKRAVFRRSANVFRGNISSG
jgi:hypothetical protein